MQRLAEHADFLPCLQQVADAAMAVLAGPADHFTLAVFCKQGEMRSVAFAALTLAILRRFGRFDLQDETIDHLSAYYWRFRTCSAASTCPQCGDAAASGRAAALETAMHKWGVALAAASPGRGQWQ